MITVLSMSPAIDKRIELEALAVGGTSRAVSIHTEGAGKGINVSLAAQALGLPVRCVGLLAGAGAPVEERLSRNGVAHAFLPAPGIVRTNLKLRSLATGEITEVSEASPEAPAELLARAANAAEAAAAKSRFLVLTGSLPSACPPGFYADIIRRVKVQAPACRIVLDADGERLSLGVTEGVWLVKPNLTELEQAAGRSLRSREDILAAARALRSRGAACVVVSMGSRGAIAVMEGAVCEAPAMEVKVRTTTGAGDAMVAGLLYGFMRGFSLDAALRCGTAAAAARCVHGGGAFLDWGDYQGLLSRTETLA